MLPPFAVSILEGELCPVPNLRCAVESSGILTAGTIHLTSLLEAGIPILISNIAF